MCKSIQEEQKLKQKVVCKGTWVSTPIALGQLSPPQTRKPNESQKRSSDSRRTEPDTCLLPPHGAPFPHLPGHHGRSGLPQESPLNQFWAGKARCMGTVSPESAEGRSPELTPRPAALGHQLPGSSPPAMSSGAQGQDSARHLRLLCLTSTWQVLISLPKATVGLGLCAQPTWPGPWLSADLSTPSPLYRHSVQE